SLTYVAKYADGFEGIINLKDSPIDINMVRLARMMLGNIVPVVVDLKATKTSHAYGQPHVSGERWDPLQWTSVEEDSDISSQLTSIFACCSVHLESLTAVDTYIIPPFDNIILLVSSEDPPFKATPRELHATYLSRLQGLQDWANNPRHRLLDWEHAMFLPVGMNGFEIRFIAVLNMQSRDVMSEAATPIILACWNTLITGIPDEHKHVVDSMEIGLVLLAEYPDKLDPLHEEIPTSLTMENLIQRLDWFEEVFRPLCPDKYFLVSPKKRRYQNNTKEHEERSMKNIHRIQHIGTKNGGEFDDDGG
ncbi:hypothetical protein BDZ97DRAFT_1654278, partial [Flammula alnicola]